MRPAAKRRLQRRLQGERRVEVGFGLVELPHLQMQPAALGDDRSAVRLHRERRIERSQRTIEVPEVDAHEPLAEGRLQMARIEGQRAIEAVVGFLSSAGQKLRHAPVAVGIGVIGLDADGAVMRLDGLLEQPHAHQRVAETGERRGKIRLQRNRPLLAFARLFIAFQMEQRQAEIGRCLGRAWIGVDRARQRCFGFLELAGIERGHAKQVQRVEMIRDVLENLAAQRLRIRMPALAIGGRRRRQQHLGLLPELLLQPCVLEGARADTA